MFMQHQSRFPRLEHPIILTPVEKVLGYGDQASGGQGWISCELKMLSW